jgi:uncharacterized protein
MGGRDRLRFAPADPAMTEWYGLDRLSPGVSDLNDPSFLKPSRRALLSGATVGAVGLALPARAAPGAPALPHKAQPFPIEAVRVTGGIWLEHIQANRKYLHSIEADRLLHNFRKFAGLEPKGQPYGGWEADTIAGHTLGHYLSACSLMHAQTGDAECKRRVEYIVTELGECQRAHGDGYVAGFTRRNGDTIENGKVLFAELTRGDIRVMPFDLNGCWVPLYNFHKTLAGLLNAHRYCGNEQALRVATGLANYIGGVFRKLDDAQVQKILDCEHGGLNESFAELAHRTGDKRYLVPAVRIYHKKVLDPLAEGRDELEGLHANTQIPKLIGLARLYELTGNPRYRKAVETFWHAVVDHHSYVIGGNSDREHFQPRGTISKYITEQTCESCNTYNMLKLTRHLYAWTGEAKYFDNYERAHLNHIMAQHRPDTGQFAYMVPLMSGAHREWSKPFDDFWCCVGTGMESHAKHGDSIYWHNDDTLFVNLFVPSRVTWRGVQLDLSTAYPLDNEVTLTIGAVTSPVEFAIAFRTPESGAHRVDLDVAERRSTGGIFRYSHTRARWRKGDKITVRLPDVIRLIPTPDDPNTIAVMRGPEVLAADLGAADEPYAGPAPALILDDPNFLPTNGQHNRLYVVSENVRPRQTLALIPFRQLHDRKSAVYFKRFTEAEWADEQKAREAEVKRLAALDARSADIVKLGDEADEKAHGLTSKISYPVSYRFRPGRDARSGGFIEFKMKARGRNGNGGPLALQATYWGDERRKLFHIFVDGTRIATERLDGGPIAFVEREYAIPRALSSGKRTITVRFEPEPMSRVGPVYGVRLLTSA